MATVRSLIHSWGLREAAYKQLESLLCQRGHHDLWHPDQHLSKYLIQSLDADVLARAGLDECDMQHAMTKLQEHQGMPSQCIHSSRMHIPLQCMHNDCQCHGLSAWCSLLYQLSLL